VRFVALVLALVSPSLSYPQIKSAVVAVRAQRPVQRVDTFEGQYDIMDCGTSDYTGGVATRASEYAYIADKALIWEADLPRLGYPRAVWGAPVARFESTAVSIANSVAPAHFFDVWDDRIDASRKGLQKALLAYRATHPHAGHIANGLGCGGGEVPVKLVTQPAATQVTIIPAFFYELCRVQRIDPNDTARCAHWREVSGPIVQVSGDYHYVAKWRDGTVKRGMLDVEAASDSGTITLRKP
jgi:hypothetical protein